MKQIYVQAQPDHIESLSKSAPIAAVEELVWNALDADAREVKVDLITNPLGAVEAVRVSQKQEKIILLNVGFHVEKLEVWQIVGEAICS